MDGQRQALRRTLSGIILIIGMSAIDRPKGILLASILYKPRSITMSLVSCYKFRLKCDQETASTLL